VWFAIVFSLLGLYFAARALNVRRLHAELSQPIGFLEGDDERSRYLSAYARAMSIRRRYLEPVGVSMLTGYQAYEALTAIDPHVISGAKFAFKNVDFDNVSEAAAWFRGLDGIRANRLAGYTAEQMVAANLAAQGHAVEFPDLANQPGYDLLVDGQPLQVKLTMDADYINDHLDRYPDVSVIANAEMAEYADAIDAVHIDPDLLYGGVGQAIESTGQAYQFLETLADKIPCITLVISASREIGLLWKGWTDVRTSLKNVALDTVSVGVAGWSGAKLGASFGSLLGPPGVAFGSVIGGTIGAVGGKKAGNVFKARAYKRARRTFEQSMVKVGECFVDACETAIESVNCQRSRIQAAAPKTIWSYLWPRRADLIRDHIDSTLNQHREVLEGHIEETKKLLAGEEPYIAGKHAVETLSDEPIFSDSLTSAIDEAIEALSRLQREMKKLGIDPSPNEG